MSSVNPEEFDCVAKLLVDAGDAPTFEAAADLLRTYRMQLVASATASADPGWQAAILTAANAGVRAMHGGVQVVLGSDPTCGVPLARGARLSDALRSVGATVGERATTGLPTIAFGASPDVVGRDSKCVWASATTWTAAVGPSPRPCAPAEVLSAVLAGSIAVSEIFQGLRGYARAGDRELALSLWNPDQPTEDGPPITDLPAGLWLLGLGHLGQAYAWLLGLLPYPIEGERQLNLMDDDRVSAANRATSMLHQEERLGVRKTRLIANVLDDLGWDSRLVERRYMGGQLQQPGDPVVLIGGVDNPQARHRLDETRVPLIYDCGLGAGPTAFLSMSIRRLPGSRPSNEIWPPESPNHTARPPAVAAGAYAELEAKTGDRCGVEELAGRTVATAFVGVTAACWAIGGLLRELHGGSAYELIDMSLRDPMRVVSIGAPAGRPPRIPMVGRAS